MKYKPINPRLPKIIHGSDYNPEQWRDNKKIWDEDFRMMKLAHCNTMTVGIFSWSALEPEEGHYDFTFLDEIMDRLAMQDAYAILATPSGARPAWLSQKYPEVLRVRENRQKALYGERHNHCITSPIYRKKTQEINRMLAERYKAHPALSLWHISNEFGGDCHCELCQEAFRNWLKKRYHNNLNELNKAWWTSFWSHTYTDWSQIISPSSLGDKSLHGLTLDWKRFVTDQTVEFYKSEILPLRDITPQIPITTNLMETFVGLDYWKFAEVLDVISWDCYPEWHNPSGNEVLASHIAFAHDINRTLKHGQPFMMMESTPSLTNWQSVSKLKKPGMHLLSSLQAVAHGSDTVQYFQWRKSRGASEKFHGAVVDHCGHENTRVFREVSEVGQVLEKLDAIVGTSVQPDVALIFDWENRWAVEDSMGYVKSKKDYLETCRKHYQTFWEKGVPVDVINMDCDFSKYKLVVAPMLYMVRKGVGERVEKFVQEGGTFVTTYCSGIVNESDLCFLGGFPGPLRNVMGIWVEETDSLYHNEYNEVFVEKMEGISSLNVYRVKEICDLIHCETAQSLATYQKDFYAGRPALTVNAYGKGKAYYIAFRNNDVFEHDFYSSLIDELQLFRAIDAKLPSGVTSQYRTDGEKEFVFVMNFLEDANVITIDSGAQYRDIITEEVIANEIKMNGFGVKILEKLKK